MTTQPVVLARNRWTTEPITMTATPRVLIVDDEPNVRLVFRTTLEPAGYAVTEAADGEEALERLSEAPTALVILDLNLGERA